jgi:ethanolamine utilization EutJ-like protein
MKFIIKNKNKKIPQEILTACNGDEITARLMFNRGINTFEEAEKIKKDKEREFEVFPIVKPVVQKMASIVKRFIQGYDVDTIYVVGGACSFSQFTKVFEKEIGVRTIKPAEPLLVTPLGIAMNSTL